MGVDYAAQDAAWEKHCTRTGQKVSDFIANVNWLESEYRTERKKAQAPVVALDGSDDFGARLAAYRNAL